jgi:hypothetical protein
MADHDQRLKALLRELFDEFLRLFFPNWADRFDFTGVEWLDKEVFTDPPQGDEQAAKQFQELLVSNPRYGGARKMGQTTYEKGLQEGRKEGRQEGLREGQQRVLRRLLERKLVL